jgi:hypothetical protein
MCLIQPFPDPDHRPRCCSGIASSSGMVYKNKYKIIQLEVKAEKLRARRKCPFTLTNFEIFTDKYENIMADKDETIHPSGSPQL